MLKSEISIKNESAKILGPSGPAKTIIVQNFLDTFIKNYVSYIDAINLNYDIVFSVESGFSILFKEKGATTQGFAFEHLSTGEKIKATICLMLMINNLSGFNTLIFDNLCDLDDNNLTDVLSFLKTNTPANSNTIIAGINTNAFIKASASEDFTTISL